MKSKNFKGKFYENIFVKSFRYAQFEIYEQ